MSTFTICSQIEPQMGSSFGLALRGRNIFLIRAASASLLDDNSRSSFAAVVRMWISWLRTYSRDSHSPDLSANRVSKRFSLTFTANMSCRNSSVVNCILCSILAFRGDSHAGAFEGGGFRLPHQIRSTVSGQMLRDLSLPSEPRHSPIRSRKHAWPDHGDPSRDPHPDPGYEHTSRPRQTTDTLLCRQD